MSDPPLEHAASSDAFGPSGESVDGYESWLPPVTRDASAALMLGILGFATCGLLSPLAVYYGSRALNQIEAAGGADGGERNARVGQILGIIGTTFLIIGISLVLIFAAGAWDFVRDLEL
jgi:hypothetical protein